MQARSNVRAIGAFGPSPPLRPIALAVSAGAIEKPAGCSPRPRANRRDSSTTEGPTTPVQNRSTYSERGIDTPQRQARVEPRPHDQARREVAVVGRGS